MNTADAWFQSADLSSVEKPGVDLRAAIAFWHAVAVDKEDAHLRRLQDQKADFCPWGMGIGPVGSHFFHVYRDLGGYQILIQEPARMLGFIPSKKERTIDGVSHAQVESHLRQWWAAAVG